jgi:uridine phosphorylase
MKFSHTDLILNRDHSVYHLNLKPHQVSSNIIVVGDPGRVHRVSRHFDFIEFEMNKREFITHTGSYKGKPITVMSTGMGTDNIEIVMMELDMLFNLNLKKRIPHDQHQAINIVRIGTSGGLQEDVKVNTALAANYGVGIDNLMLFYNLPQSAQEKLVGVELQKCIAFPYQPYVVKGSDMLKEKLAFDVATGNTLTAPGFYAPQGRHSRIPSHYRRLLDDLTCFNIDGFWLSNVEMETAALYAFARLLGHEALSINAVLANRHKDSFSKNPTKTVDEIIEKVLERF